MLSMYLANEGVDPHYSHLVVILQVRVIEREWWSSPLASSANVNEWTKVVERVFLATVDIIILILKHRVFLRWSAGFHSASKGVGHTLYKCWTSKGKFDMHYIWSASCENWRCSECGKKAAWNGFNHSCYLYGRRCLAKLNGPPGWVLEWQDSAGTKQRCTWNSFTSCCQS